MRKYLLILATMTTVMTAFAGYQSIVPYGYYVGNEWVYKNTRVSPQSGLVGDASPYQPSQEFTATQVTGQKVSFWFAYSNGNPDYSRKEFANSASNKYVWVYEDNKSLGSTKMLGVKYDWIKYKLQYSANGGSFEVQPASLTDVCYTNGYSLAEVTATRSGYTFAGWMQEGTENTYADRAQVRGADFTLDNHDDNGVVKLLARWIPNQYAVSYELKGGKTSVELPSSAQYDTAFAVSAPTRIGYAFKGWTSSNVDERYALYGKTASPSIKMTQDGDPIGGEWTQTYFKNLTAGTSEVALKANWEAEKYNVIFHNCGGSGDAGKQVTYDSAPGPVNCPTYVNHVFDGYWTGSNGTGVCYWDSKGEATSSISTWLITNNVDVYAKWIGQTYTIHYDGNGKTSGEMSDQECYFGESVKLKANAFVRDGYRFVKWLGENGTAYPDEATVADLCSSVGGIFVMTAQWAGDSHVVIFHDAKGVERGNHLVVTNGLPAASVSVPESSERYPFAGYYSDLNGKGIQYWDEYGDFVPEVWNSTANVNVYAYNPVDPEAVYYIRFNGNGATNSAAMAIQECPRSETTNLNANAFLRPGYTFQHWTNEVQQLGFEDRAEITDRFARGTTNDLFAVWKANPYAVHFDPNGATQGTMDDQQFVYDEVKELSANQFSKGSLYSFVGWSNVVSGTILADHAVVSNLSETVNATVELVAQWRSELTDLSEAMECDNLIWRNFNPQGVTWTNWYATVSAGIGHGNDSAVFADRRDGGANATLSARVGGEGTLSFWYRMEVKEGEAVDKQKLRLRVKLWEKSGESDPEVKTFPFVTAWTNCTLAITNATNDEVEWVAFMIDKVIVYLDGMTWTPKSVHPEPTPEARQDIGAVVTTGSGIGIAIASSDVRFDYELLGSDDLTLPKEQWKVVERKAGTGEALVFARDSGKDGPQMFYFVRVAQKQDE